jgi:diguanylate cyclase (GGDEF)-like protein
MEAANVRNSSTIVPGLAAALSVLAIGWLDYVTGPDYGFSLFYLVPILMSAWSAGDRVGTATGLLAGMAWFAADTAARGHAFLLVSLWNGFTRVGIFLGMGLLTAALRRDRDRLQALTRELAFVAERERRLARVDALTELPNSRAFLEGVRQQVARSQRSGAPFALAYMDIDNFKAVNDTRGHAAGDDLLRRLAAAMRESIRDEDLGGRLGGDELALLLPGATEGAAREVCERYRARVEALAADYPGCELGVSIGLVAVSGVTTETDADRLIRQADAAMYGAKESGKHATAVVRADG